MLPCFLFPVSACFHKICRKCRIGIIIQMWKSCCMRFRRLHTIPSPLPPRLLRPKRITIFTAVKIVKFMSTNRLSRFSQNLFFLRCQLHITKTPQFSGIKRMSRQNTNHLPALFFHILHRLMQIHKTTTFCQIWHACLNLPAKTLFHCLIFTELLCIQFRITAADQQSMQILRQFCIMQRGKRNDLCSHCS